MYKKKINRHYQSPTYIHPSIRFGLFFFFNNIHKTWRRGYSFPKAQLPLPYSLLPHTTRSLPIPTNTPHSPLLIVVSALSPSPRSESSAKILMYTVKATDWTGTQYWALLPLLSPSPHLPNHSLSLN